MPFTRSWEKWRIILFDQRGCGQSKPHAELEQNTTWDLVNDIEKIRRKLNINKWSVFGGSWGSTLALSYAIKHPKRCEALILRGIFMLREKELKWLHTERLQEKPNQKILLDSYIRLQYRRREYCNCRLTS